MVVGGGVIGLELGSVWARLGAKVTVIEFLDRLVPSLDLQISKDLQRVLKKQGLEILLSTKVTEAKVQKSQKGASSAKIEVSYEAAGKTEKNECDKLLVAVGRKAFTDKLGLDALGLNTDKQGKVEVDEHWQTAVKGVFAIGDVIKGPMLAHQG